MPVTQYTNPPLYDSRTSETEPLVGGKAPRRYSVSIDQLKLIAYAALVTMAITGVIFASVFPLTSCNNPLDPDVRDRILKEWAVEYLHHQEQVAKRTDLEHRWRIEDDDRVRLRNQWAREVEQHNRDIEERQKREEKERQRLNMFWTDPESHTCTSYDTREYTARLLNVPPNYNRRIEACMATPIKVHGIEYMAKRCEDHGPNKVIGHWEVNQHEPDCASYWNRYTDKGCISSGSGQRRIEHYLENLPSGSNWREFCATTPVSFRGMHFMGAQFCFQKDGGTYGHWVFDDKGCN
ncbi:hypothetical protein AZE42_08451 [Rhizopogon vesiculosus]|uniref:Uncharacterized protein n=1 Tax=Rhizopogon vesiculosus TaxID=180088 RepID=A0A1J8REF8_9AGAM|nr:hypothetical protein AZE42_08451 [Rhizopogon vesiculosus]